MKKYLILILIIIFHSVFCQDMKFLIQQNGFREIKLGSNISNYPDFVKKNNENEKYFGAIGYTYEYIYIGNEYNKIDNTEIVRIFLNTVDDLIFEILIITEKNYELWNFIESAYGKPTVNNRYIKGWYPGNIRCRLRGGVLDNNYLLEYEDAALMELARKKKTETEKEKAKKEF